MTKKLNDALGLGGDPKDINQWDTRFPALLVPEVIPEPISDAEQVSEDTDNARTGLYDALEMSKTVVQDMIVIAQSSQHPKAYEVLNAVIKTLADVSMNLADLQLKKQRLKGTRGGDSEVEQQTINNLFVGSTSELQKMIEDMKKDPNV